MTMNTATANPAAWRSASAASKHVRPPRCASTARPSMKSARNSAANCSAPAPRQSHKALPDELPGPFRPFAHRHTAFRLARGCGREPGSGARARRRVAGPHGGFGPDARGPRSRPGHSRRPARARPGVGRSGRLPERARRRLRHGSGAARRPRTRLPCGCSRREIAAAGRLRPRGSDLPGNLPRRTPARSRPARPASAYPAPGRSASAT